MGRGESRWKLFAFMIAGALVAGAAACAGKDGSSCTVAKTDTGSVITCTDGTSATVTDGADGAKGADGSDGRDGRNGANGANGAGCTVTTESDGVRVQCGSSGATIKNGADGETCTAATQANGTVLITCTDGTSATVGTATGYAPRREDDACTPTDQCPNGTTCAGSAPNFYCRRNCTPNTTGQCATGQSCFPLTSGVGGVCLPSTAKGASCVAGSTVCESGTACVGNNASPPVLQCRTTCSASNRTKCADGDSCDASRLACFPAKGATYSFMFKTASVPTSGCWDSCGVPPDLLAQVTVGTAVAGSTGVVSSSFAPSWNQAVAVTVPSTATMVTITLLDRDPETNCIFCGYVYDTVSSKTFTGPELEQLLKGSFSGAFPQPGIAVNVDVTRTGFYP